MKSLNVKKGYLVPVAHIPSSKSYANRALILGALVSRPVTLKNLTQASDVIILIDCLKAIGLKISENNNSLCIENSFPDCEAGNRSLEVGEGGTTARFLAALLLLGKCKYQLHLGERLKARPWADFLAIANFLGAYADLTDNILTIQGPAILPSEMKIDCSQTTQFATAFHLLSFTHNVTVVPENLFSSISYWEMTDQLLRHFRQNDSFDVPLDWSSASYPLAFASLNQDMFFPGLHVDPLQADAKIFNVLSELGAIIQKDDGILVRPSRQSKSFQLDVSDCLDLVPTLGFLLAHINGEHQLTGFQNLVHKESDRLSEVIKLVQTFGRQINHTNDKLIIHGSNERFNEEVRLLMPNDHRMVMAGTLFLLHHAGGAISPVNAVAKSYPEFFSLISKD